MATILTRAVRNARAMTRSFDWSASSFVPPPGSWPDASGPGGPREALALSISTVLSCVKALYDDVSVLPFGAYSGRRDGPHALLSDQPQVVREPFGPDLSPGAGMGQLVVSRAMRGDGFAFIWDRDKLQRAQQLIVLHPDTVTVRKDPKRGKRFWIGQEDYGPQDVVHIPGLMLPGAVKGVDVLTYHRVTHDLAWKVAKYGQGVFDNGGSPAGVLSVPGAGDRKRAREMQAMWDATHGGVENAHRPAVMFGGATWTQLTISPENAQFLETRRFLREEICGLYGVPLQRIQAIVDNASQGGGKGLEAIDNGYVQHGLVPAVAGIEAAWDRLVPGGSGTWTAFDFKALLRASAEQRSKIAQVHRVTGVRTADEIRADEGWDPLPDGLGADPRAPLNSNTTSPVGGADNEPTPGGQQTGEGA